MPVSNSFLIRREDDVSSKYGFFPDSRPLSRHLDFGIINLDKPAGPTSHEVADWVKGITGAVRAGHSGTLDPAVTGVLPTALNSATKILSSLLLSGKEYVGTMRLHRDVPLEELRAASAEFVGKIMQKPPVRSAVKRVVRQRSVYSLEILGTDGRTVLFRTSVEAGTYIRKLCHDIGGKIGGANMTELRRIRAGPFTERTAVTLQDLKDAFAYLSESGDEGAVRRVVLPVEAVAEMLPKIFIQDGAVEAVCSGATLACVGVTRVDSGLAAAEPCAIMTGKGELAAMAMSLADASTMHEAKRGFAARPTRVVLPSGTYPRMWRKQEK